MKQPTTKQNKHDDWLSSSNHFVLHIAVLHFQTYCFINTVPNAQRLLPWSNTAPERSQFSGYVPRGVEPLSGAVDWKFRDVRWEKMKVIAAKQCNLFCT